MDIFQRFAPFAGLDHLAVGAFERVVEAHQHAVLDDVIVLGFFRGLFSGAGHL